MPSFSTLFISVLAFTSTALAGPLVVRDGRDDSKDNHPNSGDDMDDKYNIFKDANQRFEGAICKNEITTGKFPNLVVPNNYRGGCVRYYQGIDMTGVVTEVDLFFPKIQSACDCIAACLSAPLTCTNWVYKHTFNPLDGGHRSCTLYSSPNLPTGVTLAYNLANSVGFNLLQPQNNPQAGGGAPLTFLDAANTQPDKYGVSGFLTQDVNGKQYC